LNFSKEIKTDGTVKFGSTPVAVNMTNPGKGITVSADKKTVVIDAQLNGILGSAPNYLSFVNSAIEVSGFGDGTNTMDKEMVNGTLSADKSAPGSYLMLHK
jgi:hypothetical protein